MKKLSNLKFGQALTRTIAGVVAIVIAGTMSGCARKNSSSNEKEENRIGYSSVDSSVKTENFVIIDAGNYDTTNPINALKKMKVRRQIKKCNKKDISVGIIISTSAKNEADIYDDVEYARYLVNNYKIDFPIFLDLEPITSNAELNNEMKEKIISDFLRKCSDNNIYVGIAGSDKTLQLAEKYFSDAIKGYDAYVTSSDDTIEYSGTYSLYNNIEDNKIYSSCDIAKIIESKSLNTPEGLKNDKKVLVNSYEELIEFSLKYGISVVDLLTYNELKEKDITESTEIKVPSEVNNKTSLISSDDWLIGCDISFAQDDNIDWEKLKENFEFIIIRSNQGKIIDRNFDKNIQNANLNGIYVGTYCFNSIDIMTPGIDNLEDFKRSQEEQVEVALDCVKNYSVAYPIYLDIERISSKREGKEWEEMIPEGYAISMVNIWYSRILDAGYTPGLYFNRDCYNYFESIHSKLKNKSSCTDEERNFQEAWCCCEKWLAGGAQYGKTQYDLEDVMPPSVKTEKTYPEIKTHQVTSTAINAGAGNKNGNLDVNYSKIVPGSLELEAGLEIKDPYKNAKAQLLIASGLSIATVAAGFSIVGKIKRKRKRKLADSVEEDYNSGQTNGHYSREYKTFSKK